MCDAKGALTQPSYASFTSDLVMQKVSEVGSIMRACLE
jgi:hypothetical protein